MKRVYVFDADDTLWMNEWQYSRSTAKFFAFLYEIFGRFTPNLHAVRNRYFEIDAENFKTYGVKRGRVAASMSLLYLEVRRQVIERFNIDYLKEWHIDHIRKLGDEPFDYTHLYWLPEMRDCLSNLRSHGDSLFLLSSYDRDVFPHRIRHMQTDDFFDDTHTMCVPFKKTLDDFIAISGWTPENDADHIWIAVGNAESDILPALAISPSWHGIYIPHPSTSVYVGSDLGVDHFNPSPIMHPRVKTIISARSFPYDFP